MLQPRKRRYDFPTIRRGTNVSDVFSPFAKVRTRMVPVQPRNTYATTVDVEIATPEIIVSVYLLLYVPLAMAWAYFVHYGCKEKHYLIMVPFTLCAFTVGLDLVNQSLTTLTAAPMAMTAIQAGSMPPGFISIEDMSPGSVRQPFGQWATISMAYGDPQKLGS